MSDRETVASKASLYSAGEKIYPREISGRFQRLRNISVVLLLGLYYVIPWIQWNGRQAILFDLPARKFYLFEMTLWPQDFYLLAMLLILAGLSLFFFTAIAGRVWCGYACPQTVWTEAFIWMERWVEGSRAKQMKLTAAPWSLSKLGKRSAKQFLWISFSLFTGITFVGYFVPINTLIADCIAFNVEGWTLFWMLFYGFATYGNAGFMREQVCMYMCPYARFQSAMFDKETLIVAYDESRGEPRSRGKKRKAAELAVSEVVSGSDKGDCIDCGICVQVCPTGIDIRDGLQYECIACAACVDACDEVMEKVNLPTGLIHYSSESRDRGTEKSILQSLLRPRVLIYATLLSVVFAGFITAILIRSSFQVDILRDRNALYRWNGNSLENSYHVRIMNKSPVAQQYQIDVSGIEGASARWGGNAAQGASPLVAAGQIGEFNVVVYLPENADYRRSQKFDFKVFEVIGDNPQTVVEDARFLAPSTN